MKTFRILELAIEFHESVEGLEVQGHLRDQLHRASSSIPLNLAEGNAKFSVREKKRFYQIAYGSLKECQTILRLVKNENHEIAAKADRLGASLYKLMKSDIKTI